MSKKKQKKLSKNKKKKYYHPTKRDIKKYIPKEISSPDDQKQPNTKNKQKDGEYLITYTRHLEKRLRNLETEKQLLDAERLRLEQELHSLRNEVGRNRNARVGNSPFLHFMKLVPTNLRNVFGEIIESLMQIVLSTRHLGDQSLQDVKSKISNLLEEIKDIEKKLQEQIKKDQMARSPEPSGTQKELEGKLKIQREMAIFLQKQLETKEGEIETINPEALQIKRKYRLLENDLRVKDQKINDVQRQLDSFNFQTRVQPKKEDPNLALRVRRVKDQKFLESPENIIESIMKKESVNELTIARKYLPEIFSTDILDISKDDGLPILKPFVIQYLSSKGIITEFYGNGIKFKKHRKNKSE